MKAGEDSHSSFQKAWDRYAAQADELSRAPSFQNLRDSILD